MRQFPKPYYFGQEARYEGSGGANGEIREARDTGGSGGGIIWLTSPGTIVMDKGTSVESNGRWGVLDNYD